MSDQIPLLSEEGIKGRYADRPRPLLKQEGITCIAPYWISEICFNSLATTSLGSLA